MRESLIEQYFCRRATRKGWLALKWVSPGRRGVHDRIVFTDRGSKHLVEIKAEGEDLEPHQRRLHKRLAEMGHVSHVVDSKERADEVIEWIDAEIHT